MPLPYVLSPTEKASRAQEALKGAPPSEGVHKELKQVDPEGQEKRLSMQMVALVWGEQASIAPEPCSCDMQVWPMAQKMPLLHDVDMPADKGMACAAATSESVRRSFANIGE